METIILVIGYNTRYRYICLNSFRKCENSARLLVNCIFHKFIYLFIFYNIYITF